MSNAKIIEIGAPFDPDTTGTAFTNFTLDQTTDAVEWIVQAPAAITITRLGFRYNARTGTPPTYRISLQGVTSGGLPDGTIKGATNNALKTFTPPADTSWDATWQWLTLDESYNCARGEWLAIVVDYSAGTVNGSNNGAFTTSAGYGGTRTGAPLVYHNNANARSAQVSNPIYGYTSSDTTYGRPATSITGTSFSSGSSPNEYGLRFTLPSTWFASYQVLGVKWFGTVANSAGDSCTVSLYDADGDPGTVLQQIVYDWDYNTNSASNTRVQTVYFDEATLATLLAGRAYTIGLKADQASLGMAVYGLTVPADADRDAWPGGAYFARAARSGSTWTVTTTIRPILSLILADVAAPLAPTYAVGV